MMIVRQIVLFVVFLTPSLAWGQSGSVRYSHTYPLLQMPLDQVDALFAEEQGKEPPEKPTHATLLRTLTFSPAVSRMVPTVPQDFGEEEERPEWEYVDTTYVDLEAGTYTEARVFADEGFRISDTWSPLNWRLSGEERTYLGYRVMKAIAVQDSAIIEAWFAPEVPVPAGPGLYGGLPGLILMVTNATIGEVYAAEFIDLEVPIPELTPPVAGQAISRKVFYQWMAREFAQSQRAWETIQSAKPGDPDQSPFGNQ